MQTFAERLAAVCGRLPEIIWGKPLLILLAAVGIWFTVRTGFFQFAQARLIAQKTLLSLFKRKRGSLRRNRASARLSGPESGGVFRESGREPRTDGERRRGVSPFQALTTALSATIGTGNIVGVAAAVAAGGAGAVFWMWVSALGGMMTKYAEIVLGISYRRRGANGEWCGGAMYYLERGLGEKKGLRFLARPLAVLFASFTVLASFGIGNMSQANTIAVSMQRSFSVPPLITGIVIAAAAALVIFGGIRRLAAVTEKLVPFMALGYIAAALAIIVMNAAQLPEVIADIFRGAFGFDAVAGGVSGILLKRAVALGLRRGMFSNEAGLGSSAIGHSAAEVREPAEQGMWGIFEVFVDTIVVCTLTAFAVLTSGAADTVGASAVSPDGAALVGSAFDAAFHGAGGALLAVAVLLFAFSTVLGWSYYGAKALEYLCGTRAVPVYRIIYIAALVAGSVMELGLVWNISDALNGLMALPNLIGLLLLSGRVVAITKNYLAHRR